MIQVAGITGSWTDPASRLRVRQHIAPLCDLCIAVTEYAPALSKYSRFPCWPERLDRRYGLPFFAGWECAKLAARMPAFYGSWRSQITWLLRPLLEGCPTIERFLKSPLVLDVDDAVWLTPPFGKSAARAAARRADIVIAGNDFLADWFSGYASDVRIIPTAVDTGRYRSDLGRRHTDRFTIGWIGTSWSLVHLEAIEVALNGFMSAHRDAELLVVADRPPAFRALPADRVRFVAWSEEADADLIQQMDVGLMPLLDNDVSRGKCSYKMLQYLACGVPVIVSPVGVNPRILSLGRIGLAARNDAEWQEALTFFHSHRALGVEYGRAGRAVVERHYSREVVTPRIAGIFRAL
jgi:glycosyltransferase involved in cell wall biosynthesis